MGLISGLFELQRELTENLGGGATSGILPQGVAVFDKDGGKEKTGRCIYCSDASLLTIYEVKGTHHHYNNEMIANALLDIANALKPSFKKSGHTLQICMHHDRDRAKEIINDLITPMTRASQNLGIDVGVVTNNWGEVLEKYTAGEYIYLALWTHPNALVPAVLKEEMKKRKLATVGQGQQNPTKALSALRTMHATYVASMATALRGANLVFEELAPEAAVRAMRMMFDEEWTRSDWKPWLLDKSGKTMASLPYTYSYRELGSEWIMPESLANQIAPREAEIINNEMIRIGSRIHYPFMNKLMPQQIIGFRAGFFNEAITQTYPWRMTFTIRGGQGKEVINSALARVLQYFSGQNRKINQAYEYMKEYSEQADGTPVGIQVSYDTWVDSPTITRDDIAKLRKQQAQFAGAVQAWGTQEVSNITGDPYPVLISTIPGLNWRSPAPVTLAPIEEVFQLLPLVDRAASPWKSGLPLRTPDGKLYPYSPMSTHQAAWITFGVAPMGSGKSVLANVENLAFVLNPDLPDYPYLSIIDVGPSSSGLIKMFRDLLPPDKKHYACEFLLDNNTGQGINVFDTGLGCRQPFSSHHGFLVNFLTLLATPVSAKEPYDGIQAFARTCLDAAYRITTEKQPKIYKPGMCPEVDEWIDHTGFKTDKHTTWWELTDVLFSNNQVLLATTAQRYAVPLLEDIAQASTDPMLRKQYLQIKMPTGEMLPDYFNRRIHEAIDTYPVLRSYTKFDIGDARIVSIDLDRFKGQGAEGAKTMAIMFMVCQQVMAGRYYQDWSDLNVVPKAYQEYHKKQIKHMKDLPKRLVMDEVHRITTNGGVVAQQFVSDICTRARESRKWGVSFAMWTQMYNDIPKEIVELTTTLYVLGAGTAEGAKEIAQIYDMTPEIASAIFSLPPPGPQGSSMLALYRTKDGLPYYHILTLTIGLYMLWALSSTKNERNIRDALTREFGFGKALDILVKLYPRNISKIIEERQRDKAKRGEGGDVVDEIIAECIKYGKEH